MFRFEHPEYLWALLGVPLIWIAVAGFARLRATDWERWGTPESNARLAGFRLRRGNARLAGLLAVLFVFTLANPQWGTQSTAVTTSSSDVFILLDISSSMLAEDIPPSRMERARQLALRLAQSFRTERVGLVFFAGNAYLQSPLTTDGQAIRLFLQAADPAQAGTQGTAIGEAIRLVLKDKKSGEPSGGMMILLTDGEDHDEDAVDAARKAADAGWVTEVVGIGTLAGGTIPVFSQDGRGVKRDADGQPVRTRLHPDLLQELAAAGGGDYFDLTRSNDVPAELRSVLDTLDRHQATRKVYSDHRSLYGWLLLPGLLALLVMVARHPYSDPL